MEFELVEMTPEQREMALYEEAVEHSPPAGVSGAAAS